MTYEVAVVSERSGEQACVSFWNVATGQLIRSYKSGVCARNALSVVDSFLLAGQHNTQLIHFYDVDTEQIAKKVVCPGKVSALAVSPDGQYCVVALAEKICIWQITTGRLMKVLSKHYQTINCIRFTHDGTFFITAGDDHLLLVWNFLSVCQPKDDFCSSGDSGPVFSISDHSLPVRDVHVGAGGCRSHLVTCSLDQTCKIYDISSGQLVCTFLFESVCTAVTMDTAEKRMFTGCNNGKIYFVILYQQQNNNEVHVPKDKSFIQAHIKEINSLSISLDGSKLLSGSLDCSVKVWHISSKQCLRTFSFKGEITNLMVMACPAFLRENHIPSKDKPPVPIFQRTVYTPQLNEVDFNAKEWTDCTSVALKQLDYTDFYDDFVLPTDEKNINTQINQVMMQCGETNVEGFSLKSATRSELVNRIKTLEAVTKEFYTLATQNILKDG